MSRRCELDFFDNVDRLGPTVFLDDLTGAGADGTDDKFVVEVEVRIDLDFHLIGIGAPGNVLTDHLL